MKTMRRASVLALAALAPVGLAPAAGQDNDIQWNGVFSDTTSTFVSPINFSAGQKITLKLRARANDLTGATLRLWFNGVSTSETLVEMTKATSSTLFDFWSGQVTVPLGTTAVYYRFILKDGSDTDYYDAGAPADSWDIRGMSDEPRGEGYNFVLVPGFATPAWAQEAVFYQIFPDRFYDGEPTNNRLYPDDCLWYLDYAPASPEAAECAAYPTFATPTGYSKFCEVHDTWDEAPNGGPCDFFGGDLMGVEDKLSYIKDLQATAIYLNPIFRSMSNHKYDTLDYDTVDPRFGSTAALGDLTTAANSKGLRTVVDGVFNHVADLGKQYNGWANFALTNGTATGYDFYPSTCGAYEEVFLSSTASNFTDCKSPWRDWFHVWIGTDQYDVDRDGNKSEQAGHTCGWYGFEFMPEIDYKSPSTPDSSARTWLYAGSKATSSADAKASLAGKWLSDGAVIPKGIDGWRLDVPDNAGYFTSTNQSDCSKAQNDLTLWKGFQAASKTVGPDKYVVGELWKDATTNGGVDWTKGPFDGVMNYHYFAMPISCFITDLGVHNDATECVDDYAALKGSSSTSISSLDAHLAKERRLYPAPFYLASQNLLSSHDTSRFISRAKGDTNKLKQAEIFQATLPGAPMVYYGDELGVAGINNELGRATFPWTALETPNGTQAKLREFTRSVMCLRRSYPALQTGSFMTLWVSDAEKTYGYGRFDATDHIAVAINNSSSAKTVKLAMDRLDVIDGTVLTDVMTGNTITVTAGVASVSVPANSGVVLVPSDRASLGRTCADPNDAPTANAGPDKDVKYGTATTLSASASSDPERQALSYRWTDVETGEVLGTSVELQVTASSTIGVTKSYELWVSDGVYSDMDSVSVTATDGGGGGGCRMEDPRGGRLGLVAPLFGAGLGLAFWRRRRK